MLSKLIFLALLFSPLLASASEIHIACASNFAVAMKDIAKQFEASFQHKTLISTGSTGKLYAQIIHGAPYDIFAAADSNRPELLSRSGIAISSSRFTYAVGILVLWSNNKNFVDPTAKVLDKSNFKHLAIANPKTAPYGKAALETLEYMNLLAALKSRIVYGENVAQAFQFAASGGAELGFISLSQVTQTSTVKTKHYWVVPQDFYQPIEQQAVLLQRAKHNQAANDFIVFLRTSNIAHDIIEHNGYHLDSMKSPLKH